MPKNIKILFTITLISVININSAIRDEYKDSKITFNGFKWSGIDPSGMPSDQKNNLLSYLKSQWNSIKVAQQICLEPDSFDKLKQEYNSERAKCVVFYKDPTLKNLIENIMIDAVGSKDMCNTISEYINLLSE